MKTALVRVRREAFELLEPIEHDPEFRWPHHRSPGKRQKTTLVWCDTDVAPGMGRLENHFRLADAQNWVRLYGDHHELPAAPIKKVSAVSPPSGPIAFPI